VVLVFGIKAFMLVLLGAIVVVCALLWGKIVSADKRL
jgi:hypothetical protein